MVTYSQFILKYPVYGNFPYISSDVTQQLEEIAVDYPSIYSCLPSDTQLRATKLAFEHDRLLEDCDFQGVLAEISSRNDTAKFVTTKTPYALNSSLPGRKLSNLFKMYGCHHTQAESGQKNCNC
jgi:hypothetical protein